MGRILIFTMGTRGDVQPYIFLARALKEAGHEVIIGTHPCWKGLITEYGVGFSPVGPDIDIEMEAAIIRGKEKGPLMGFIKTMKFVFKIIENSSDEVYALCKNADLVIASHSRMGAAEAEACHVKTISVTLQTEMIPEVLKPKTRWKKFTDNMINGLINPMIVKPYNRIRSKYSLHKIKSMDEMMSPYCNLIPISKYVMNPNPYWENKNKLVGYWYEEKEYEPSDELQSFLNNIDKPIILAMGAMSFESKEEVTKLDIFVKAFKQTGMRAVIQGFHQSLKQYQLPETMMAVGSIPHNWLFKQGYLVIHHGGFGTSASAMIYGIPSIVIPHVLDQFALADRLYKLKVSAKPIKVSDLSIEDLVGAIEECKKNYDELKQNVTKISDEIKNEQGLETSVQLINQVMNTEG